MKSYLLLSIALLFALNISSKSQIYDPVSWNFSKEKISEKEYLLTFKATIEKGWHMYSMDIPEGGPIPTSFHFQEGSDYQLTGSVKSVTNPAIKEDPFFGR